MSAVTSLTGVQHRYGKLRALDDVSLDIPSGVMVALIGPDGVGKSTLLGLVAGVRKLQAGKVEVLGGDIADMAHRRAVCARIAYMPQGLGRNLYPTLSVRENVDFFGRLFGQSAAERAWRIDELLAGTGLAPFADRPAGKLSGGMKQKLGLCCALIHDPDLLILDEPTTGVDPLSRKQFWELIGRIKARRPGMSVIVATAYMEEARRFDHLVVMHAGRVLAAGTVEELLGRTGAATLEEAFIAMLPEELRAGHQEVVLRPRVPRPGEFAIEASGLTMRFGDFTAVDHVSVAIEPGEIFGFLGSNGCGKTTTMKMLTGLLRPTEGTAKLFGAPVTSFDLETRRRVGYMSQSFSLYGELTCRQNLALHARLFQLGGEQGRARIAELASRFALAEVLDELPERLPLGVRQRLQLAAAVLHRPEMLILDEPTSGVDPIARDSFWELLIRLSREDGVTIFISTHFMNEAMRCDRISLMHAGRVLAMDTPLALQQARGAATLEEAFIGYLQEASGDGAATEAGTSVAPGVDPLPDPAKPPGPAADRQFDPRRLWAFTRREATEVLRDPIRLAFATLGPLVLLVAMSFGISFDIDRVELAVLDGDRSQASRAFVEQFSGSRYFVERPPITGYEEIDRRLVQGEIRVALTIPPGFGRDLMTAHPPEVGVWLDGSNTNRAETTRGYVQGVQQRFIAELAMRESGDRPMVGAARIEPRFRYNQSFESINAIAPGVLMMLLAMVPAMLTALGVVREKELGSITNLYSAPASRLEFLLGKQLPYVGVAMLSFVLLVGLIVLGFGVPLAGSFWALAAGALLYTTATTAFGLVVSTFVRSQIAAIFATAIIVMIPTVNFSGMMYPVSTLEGGARMIGQLFPAMYFQAISSGTFNKGLGLVDLFPSYLALGWICLVYWLLATLLLSKQER